MKRFPWLWLVLIALAAFATPSYVASGLSRTSGRTMGQQTGNDLFQQALSKERAEGRLDQAIQLYQRIVKE